MATENNDVAYGSDETYEHTCDICREDQISVEAKAFCKVCRQYLCNACHRSHSRIQATRDHGILTGSDLPNSREVQFDEPKSDRESDELPTYTQGNEAPTSGYDRSICQVINQEEFDSGSSQVSSIEILRSGHFLLCSHVPPKIVLFNPHYTASFQVDLSSLPWSMTISSPLDAVVSLPNESCLQYVKIENLQSLKLAEKIQTKIMFRKLLKFKQDMIALSEDSKAYYFCVIDKEGHVKRHIRQEPKGSGMLKLVYFMALSPDSNAIYVTDFYNGCYGITLSGDVIFKYRSKSMNDYVGVATDLEGFIYLSGPGTGNIEMINTKGKKLKDFNMIKEFVWPYGLRCSTYEVIC